ncbi:MAG: DEAD/DEAH box helicase, partial [Proteobacteria bacterium]|nr:DEAD/DEAH box helicase [Pseudomonadota bacterium]
RGLKISLPSTRVDSFSVEVADAISRGKKHTLTIAPEAGSQRLRNTINKLVTEQDLLSAVEHAFSNGWTSVKMYFMVGQPTETDFDIEEIGRIATEVKRIGRQHIGGRARVRVSTSNFIPKAHTPYQWVAQCDAETLSRRHQILKDACRKARVQFSWEDPEKSLLEAVLSRGDRRVAEVVYSAWRLGAKFDAWSEHHDWSLWQRAFEQQGVDPSQYAHRDRDLWETLPWDSFSPHQDIISQRLSVLSKMPDFSSGIVIASAQALLQRLPPLDYVAARSMSLASGQQLHRDSFIESLIAAGYYRVSQVSEHGEVAVRGSLIDVFPMGSSKPIRMDFFDDEIESLRLFSADTQLSDEVIDSVNLLPAREIPLDAQDVKDFRERYRERFEGQPGRSRVYRDVSDGIAHGGIEYYLPLFFEHTTSLFDYLPEDCITVYPDGFTSIIETAWQEVLERYELCRLDPERPVLAPTETFHDPEHVQEQLGDRARIRYSAQSLAENKRNINLATRLSPALKIEARYEDPANALMAFVRKFEGRILFTTDSAGRREQVFDLLAGRDLDLARVDHWAEFLAQQQRIGVAIAPLENGMLLPDAGIAIIGEQQLFGERARQKRKRRRSERDPESIIRQLDDLQPGSPVVHAKYGVGRYLGLTTLETGGIKGEFLQLEYAGNDKLYVPVHALDLITRYTGAAPEKAPLHRLGSEQWARAKQRAAKRARDVAAELLDVHARRAARPGYRFRWSEADYRAFESGFAFEPTEDQSSTIDDVLADLSSDQPMDRIVCGDVGFGKTEVAMRATFAAVHGGKQVAILVPTTLLAQQHGENFRDRFADWPVRIEVLSRFQSAKQVREIVAGMQSGNVDVVIGTHRLLSHTRDFKDL